MLYLWGGLACYICVGVLYLCGGVISVWGCDLLYLCGGVTCYICVGV